MSSFGSDFLSFSAGNIFFITEKSSGQLICSAEDSSTFEVGKIAINHLQFFSVETPRPNIV
jgi:hypothetical protein